jgi:hypothetical protein
VTHADPFGQAIVSDCDISTYLDEKKVKGFWMTVRAPFKYSSNKAAGIKTDIESVILATMINSVRVFVVAGSDKKKEIANLKLHVAARRHIVSFARRKSFRFGAGRNFDIDAPRFWQKVPVVRRVAVVDPRTGRPRRDSRGRILFRDAVTGHIWTAVTEDVGASVKDAWTRPEKYTIACLAGTALVVQRGILEALGKREFNRQSMRELGIAWNVLVFTKEDKGVLEKDWIPGDWGYVDNTKYVRGRSRVGTEGENVIYLGGDEWWGHLSTTSIIKKLGPQADRTSWLHKVWSWDGGARVLSTRRRPKAGLDD